jgi:serine/threonine protein kinase
LAQTTPLTVNMFTFGNTVGTGTFGRVRVVTHSVKNTPMHFALKMLKKSVILQLKQVEHIKSEKKILAEIVHPFIVNMYASWQDEGNLYMLMEYVIGGELFSILRKKNRFASETARFYACEIVCALEYLHAKDIAYRDLKPENLLIDGEGHMKITDFGFAKHLAGGRTWTLCGTPEYLAPEIIQSKGHGKDVDWWALGILIYEMLVGMPPYFAESPFEVYQRILGGDLKFPSHVDGGARDLITNLLQADRSLRYGCLRDGAEDVKRHRWFRGVSWPQVLQRRVRAPFVPGFRSPADTSNFDSYPDDPSGDIGLPLGAEHLDVFANF